MSLSSISIKRPVLATVMSIAIVLFGAIGYKFLGVREYPSIDPPIITVKTNYTGANADVVESQITEPLERSINGIAGIRTSTSSSALGASQADRQDGDGDGGLHHLPHLQPGVGRGHGEDDAEKDTPPHRAQRQFRQFLRCRHGRRVDRPGRERSVGIRG